MACNKMGSLTPESDLVPFPPKVSVLNVRIGKVRPLADSKFTSAINKQPQQGKVYLTKLGFSGDERRFVPHQSPDNAVHQYCMGHYDSWKTEMPDHEHRFKIGAFGENLTTHHLSESNVCIGDIFRLGNATVQVTMNRQPCFKLNHRFGYKKMAAQVQGTGRTGWLYRVLNEGFVEEGDDMELIDRPNPSWSLARLIHFLYTDQNNAAAMTELIRLAGLSEELIELFQKRLQRGAEDMSGRLGVDDPMPWQSYTLVQKERLTPRIQKFVFTANEQITDAKELAFPQFPHVRIKFGPDSKFTRAYSVVSGDLNRFELGIARDDNSRGGSVYLHDKLGVGDVLQVAKGHSASGKNVVDQLPHNKRHIFILGGIGVTAFMGEIKSLAKHCVYVEVHYAVRSREEAAYLNLLPRDKTTIYAKSEGQRFSVTDVIPPLADTTDMPAMIYCCGPTPLIDAVRDLTEKIGYPPSQVHFEEFGGVLAGTGDPFEVEVKSTGKVLQVPKEKSLLDILNEAGFNVDSSCLAGNCGACMVEYCKGDVAHKGVALDDEQKETTLLSCVSRGKGRIILNF
ncbi:PK beta-barrel-protein domain-containing protein-like protein [Xylariaceae sp. FL0255]|nr:PK beta-barrel-protein domain-containing protein-like protein [Xylariaceae sp. FL0255]